MSQLNKSFVELGSVSSANPYVLTLRRQAVLPWHGLASGDFSAPAFFRGPARTPNTTTVGVAKDGHLDFGCQVLVSSCSSELWRRSVGSRLFCSNGKF
jgi:hypothetical protein